MNQGDIIIVLLTVISVLSTNIIIVQSFFIFVTYMVNMEVWQMWDKIIPNQKTHKNPIIYDPLKVIGEG